MAQAPNPEGLVAGRQSSVQKLDWFERWWDVTLPPNFADDYWGQPFCAVHEPIYAHSQHDLARTATLCEKT